MKEFDEEEELKVMRRDVGRRLLMIGRDALVLGGLLLGPGGWK